MRVLADTHALVWALTEPSRLSRNSSLLLTGPDVVASVASLWELCIKAGKRTSLLDNPVAWWAEEVRGSGIDILPIKESHVVTLASLASIHKDPFDRIIIAQALAEQLPLITKDEHMSRYGIQTIW